MPGIAALFRPAHVVLAAALAAGCAGGQPHRLLDVQVSEPSVPVAATHTLFVTTTREPSADRAEVFGGARGSHLGYARVAVTVPQDHQAGQIERPRRGSSDPALHFAASALDLYAGPEAFSSALGRELAANGRRALVFVHGYRTLFDDSVYRTTQIIHDSGYSGTPILFSWASAGRTVDYIYDNNSATIGRDGLEDTLRLIARAGAERIDIVAHSMGNWALMEALRQLAISGDREIGGKLGDVVLASPDIDIDVFKSQLTRVGRPDRPFFVLVSGDDRALLVSSIIAGNRPRLGDYSDAEDLARRGVIVVNMSNVAAGDSFNHTKFADNPVLVRLLGERLTEDDRLGGDGIQVGERIERLVQGIGQTVGTAAEIIITTPIEVISVAVGN